eukprot:TRINITY_DN76520_c0_g1_i1.p1 TRINITY_DN76520_c0_g1~~TRINITY_DN76520_c0_g1_i1.p1  ORF type:complete len:482 (-),score=71.37 TRINITY_DN76520_c0_g1_i1:153-1568(-)
MPSAVDACPVCFNPFDDPQLLGKCGHTFCKRCVDQLRPRWCPTCRTPFTDKDVRKNYALIRMLDEQHTPQPSAPIDSASAPLIPVAPSWQQAFRGSGADVQPPMSHRTSLGNKLQVAKNLATFGIPFGLAQLIGEEDNRIAVRVFLLDNSGSTSAFDGAHYDESAGGYAQRVPCSRWEEVRRMAIQQAAFNAAVGTACEFIILNPPRPRSCFTSGMDFVAIDPSRDDVHAQLALLHRMLEQTKPNGPTPLAERIEEIKQRLRTHYGHLAQDGLSAVVVIATDGLPTDGSFGGVSQVAQQNLTKVLRRLASDLPVFIVLRLCTDEDNVVEFYNRIDEEEELPLEVIDDLESEAREISKQGNGWFTYSPVIHMIREGGTNVKLLDVLDERKLTPLESRLLAGHLLMGEGDVPLPLGDIRSFLQEAERRVCKMGYVYDPLLHKPQRSVNIKGLRRAATQPGLLKWLLLKLICYY